MPTVQIWFIFLSARIFKKKCEQSLTRSTIKHLMKPIILLALLLTAFTVKKSGPLPELTCTLTSDKVVYKTGEQPWLTIGITNNSKEDIYLVGSLDGSDVKWRFPYCYFSIQKPLPDTPLTGRCGVMNPLRPADFRLVKAGQKFNPYEDGFFEDYSLLDTRTFKNPGEYRIRFYYSTNSESMSRFMGTRSARSDPDSLKMAFFFKHVPKVELASNEITIRVEE